MSIPTPPIPTPESRARASRSQATQGRRPMSPYVILLILVFAALIMVGAIALSRQIASSSPAKPMPLGSTGEYALFVQDRETVGQTKPFSGTDMEAFGEAISAVPLNTEYSPVLGLPTAFESAQGVPYQVIAVPEKAGYLISDSALEPGVLYTISDQPLLDEIADTEETASPSELTLFIPVVSEFSATSVVSKDRFEETFKLSETIEGARALMFTGEAPANYAFVSTETFVPLLDRMFPSIKSDEKLPEDERDILWQDEQGNLGAAGITRGAVAVFYSLGDAEKASKALIDEGFDPRH